MQSAPQATEQNELTDIELIEVSCVKRGANPGARILLAKVDGADFHLIDEPVAVVAAVAAADTTDTTDEDTAESAEKALKGAQKMEVTQTQPDANAVNKALADAAEFQKKLEEATASIASIQKQLTAESEARKAAETEVRKERDTRILNEYTEIAKTRFSHVPTDKPKLGALLKSIHEKLTAEEAEAVEKILDAANGQAKLLTQPTGELYTQVDESTATGQLRTMAKARAERDKVEFGKALADVSRENPKLYQQSRDERAKGVQ